MPLQTVRGAEVVTELATMDAGPVGTVTGLLVPEESSSALALGRLVRDDGASCVRLGSDPDQLALADKYGEPLPLRVRDDVPSLLNSEDVPKLTFLEAFIARTMAAPGKELPEREERVPAEPELPAQEADFRGEQAEDFDMEVCGECEPACGHNWFTHRPSDPKGCYVCREAKMKRAAAHRVQEPKRAESF